MTPRGAALVLLELTWTGDNIRRLNTTLTLGFVYRFAAVDGFGKPGKSAAAAAITLTTQGEMCI